MTWEFWIDRGGTFTDVIGRAPDGTLHVAKLLSSVSSPADGVRALLEREGGLAPGAPLPACSLRLGTTVATNALLERRGVPTLLVANRGLGDLLEIGTQERPELFELCIHKPPPLPRAVLEVAGRSAADGALLEDLDEEAVRAALAAARADGIESVAIALIHATVRPELEARLAAIARAAGFEHVVASHEIANEQGLLARGETAVVDAYLTPLLRRHVAALERALPGSRLRFMQSSGGLADAARFRGPSALLSGPAGGVVGAARVAAAAGFARAVGFDMGGTSTDVSLLEAGALPRAFETQLGGLRLKAPMLRVHSVAAGGGSLCRFDGFRQTIGPESAGAEPGPLCYGRPEARELALTDANFWLGRVQPDRFPFPLQREPVARALAALQVALRKEGFERGLDEIAAGFVAVANASMAEAISQVTTARGVDPRGCALIGFGGAAGQHVCALARAVGQRNIVLHPFAGILSAWGIGMADVSWDGQRDAGRVPLPAELAPLPAHVRAAFDALAAEGVAALRAEGVAAEGLATLRSLDLRYVGTETVLSVPEPADARYLAAFEHAHEARFGYVRAGRAVEITAARVRVASPTRPAEPASERAAAVSAPPAPLRHESVWFPGVGRVRTPVHRREALGPGTELAGPALLLEETGTLALDPGFRLRVREHGVWVLEDEGGAPSRARDTDVTDPVRLEVFGHRFMSIAEQMGAVLRNTSVSTNIKERLDYSCAVFDRDGGLVANAPHIPVHLGAMGETVRAVRQRFPDLAEGDVVATNDPFAGGSHLPDVTAVTPVFAGGREPAFFVASRGHHADIGGIAPGSMPADSHSLEDEGVLIEPRRVVQGGRFDEPGLRTLLASARHPARAPDDNVAELEAMVAANRAGVRLLETLVAEQGTDTVAAGMAELQRAAAGKVRREIAKLRPGVHRFADRMDDGTPVCATLEIAGDRMRIDFAGTGPASPGNLNAPRAVVQAAALYVLRCLVAERIPLNGGCLEPVEIRVPPGSLLDPPRGAAVVGGNVETSQRVVDVLLGALGIVAASQGTMNNVAFGNDRFGYYETIGGGAGAGPGCDGASGVHTHMTNTRITDAEVLESRYPVRLVAFALRRGSGGAGRWRGGDGLVRHFRFLAPVRASLLTERRTTAPYGQDGGAPGLSGRNAVVRSDGRCEELPHRASVALDAGDELVVETPGGGGYGSPVTQLLPSAPSA
ncbi:MAG TPA: hydantoinase B/oxoprolinase family protein [Myxococcota bacterium]|nr:hydantoinase B/oxoprolinase family protein [Myxococcota bacterium]